jgi:hypothetical protein
MKAYDVCLFVDMEYNLPFWVEKVDDYFYIDLNPSTIPNEIHKDCQIEIQEILNLQFNYPKSIKIMKGKIESECIDNFNNETRTVTLQYCGKTDETVVKFLMRHVRESLLDKLVVQEFNQFISRFI